MGIKLGDAPTKPGITFDQVFLVSLHVRQNHSDDNTATPIYDVTIKYRTYGIDQNNVRHYSGEGIHTIKVHDWITHCMEHHPNDPPILGALTAIQDAVAILVAEDRQTTATVT